jgi:hypothetical protein
MWKVRKERLTHILSEGFQNLIQRRARRSCIRYYIQITEIGNTKHDMVNRAYLFLPRNDFTFVQYGQPPRDTTKTGAEAINAFGKGWNNRHKFRAKLLLP